MNKKTCMDDGKEKPNVFVGPPSTRDLYLLFFSSRDL